MTISITSFTPGTTIASSPMNGNFNAIVNALSGSASNNFIFLATANNQVPLTAHLPSAPSSDQAVLWSDISADTAARIATYIRSSDGYGGLMGGAGGSITAHLYAQSGGWLIPEALTVTGTITGTCTNANNLGGGGAFTTAADSGNSQNILASTSPGGGAMAILLRAFNGTSSTNILSIGSSSPSGASQFRDNGGLYYNANMFTSGTGSGTFSHNFGTTPHICLPICNASNSSQTMGYDTLGSSTVHITAGGGLAWNATFF